MTTTEGINKGEKPVTTNLTDEQLKRLVQLVQEQPKELPKILSTTVYQKYLDTHKLSPYTKREYDNILLRFAKTFPYLPSDPLQIEEYIYKLTNLKTGESLPITTLKHHFKVILLLLNFAVSNFNFIDYIKKLNPPTDHQSNTEEQDHPFWTPEQLLFIISETNEGQDRLIILTLIDSGCRIGELGFNSQHSGLTVDYVHPELEQIWITGKTGFHKMHCSAELCELLIQNASPNGAIFYSSQSPAGLSDKALTSKVRYILMKILKKGNKQGIFNTTSKKGAHTLTQIYRHEHELHSRFRRTQKQITIPSKTHGSTY
jgi:hypothetical protein